MKSASFSTLNNTQHNRSLSFPNVNSSRDNTLIYKDKAGSSSSRLMRLIKSKSESSVKQPVSSSGKKVASSKKEVPEQGAGTSLKSFDGQKVWNNSSVNSGNKIEIWKDSPEGTPQNSANAPAAQTTLQNPLKSQHFEEVKYINVSDSQNPASQNPDMPNTSTSTSRQSESSHRPAKRQHGWSKPTSKNDASATRDTLRTPMADTSGDSPFKNKIRKIGNKTMKTMEIIVGVGSKAMKLLLEAITTTLSKIAGVGQAMLFLLDAIATAVVE